MRPIDAIRCACIGVTIAVIYAVFVNGDSMDTLMPIAGFALFVLIGAEIQDVINQYGDRGGDA